MRTNLIITVLFAIIMCSCKTYSPEYLPVSDTIDTNQFGSYIVITSKSNDDDIKGELIAIDSNRIVVLSEEINKCINIPIEDIEEFILRYAEPEHYGWTIPVSTLVSFSHGMFAVFTLPLNLISTSTIWSRGEKAFQYNDEEMSFHRLKMFARFPQGIPTNIDLSSIK